MPIYEYRRPDGSTFEVMQSFSEAPLTHDPETGVEVKRVLHAPAVHFKGSGFYNTDYGTRRRQRENGAEDGASSKDGASAGEKGAAGDSGSAAGGGSEGGKGVGEGKTASKQDSASKQSSKTKREPVGA